MSSISARSQRASSRPSLGSRPQGRTELHCNFCNKIFFKTEHLHRHERSHTKERPFHCETCKKYFSRHDTLLRHLKKLHNTDGNQFLDLNSPLETSTESLLSESREIVGLNRSIDLSHPNIECPLSLNDNANRTIEEAINPSLNYIDWNPHVTCPDQSWWFDFNFDANALDMSLFDAFPFQADPQEDLPTDQTTLPRREIQRAWFTHIDGARNSEPPHSSERFTNENATYELDDEFRMRACQRLRNPLNVDPLPSTGLLNLTVKMYFDTFAPLFPILHRHTFRPSPENAPLLLLMSALGCLLEGEIASVHGIRIFERFIKSVMALWDSTLRSDLHEAISLIQAAVLAQTFGMLSGVPRHLEMVDSFHGTVIAWARRLNMFQQINTYPKLENKSNTDLDNAWKLWARSEEMLRTALGLYILDTQIASICHHDPLLRHDTLTLHMAAHEDVFNAPNASRWMARILSKSSTTETQLSTPINAKSQFSFYVTLQNINARICESQSRELLIADSQHLKRLSNDLLSWHRQFQDERPVTVDSDSFDLIVLWHTAFMNLLVDFNKLERGLGRDGLHIPSLESDIAYAVTWSKSAAADRCILHAFAIQNALSNMRLKTEPAIHVPHCAFLTGITAYSCLRFRRPAMLARHAPHQDPSSSRLPSDFPEFNLHGELEQNSLFDGKPVLFENERGELFMRSFTRERPILMVGADVFRQTCVALEKMGNWEVARSYAKTLKILIYVEVERWMHG
ncbi:hypothetical protein N431DRAFT_558369 [Stipitochalara longipes BDJ]|nr:hypothetical protein N431DRAFT_558369 [Stipitochalara longipes BDJ]